jgi:anaphase-promoting complex subunit 8
MFTGRPIQDFAKSSLRVAEYHLRTNGDLLLAREYLATVAASNVEEVVRAAELLKAVNLALHKEQGKENN